MIAEAALMQGAAHLLEQRPLFEWEQALTRVALDPQELDQPAFQVVPQMYLGWTSFSS